MKVALLREIAIIIFRYLIRELLALCLIGGLLGCYVRRASGALSMVLESTYEDELRERGQVERGYLHDLIVLRPDGRFSDVHAAFTNGNREPSVVLRIRGMRDISVSGAESEQIPATDSTARPTRSTGRGSVLDGVIRTYLLPTNEDIRSLGEQRSPSEIRNQMYLEEFARVWQSERVNRSDHTFHDFDRLGFDVNARISFLSYVFSDHVTISFFFDSSIVLHLHISPSENNVSISGNPEDIRLKIMEALYVEDKDGVLTCKCLESFSQFFFFSSIFWQIFFGIAGNPR